MFRNQAGANWIQKAVLFTIASSAAGLATGALLGLVGSAVPFNVRLAVATLLATAAALLGASELLGRAPPLPQCSRETPQKWVHAGPLRWAAVNGLALGNGCGSRLGFWSWYAIPAASLLAGSLVLGALIYGAYGLSRGAAVWGILAWSLVDKGRTTFDQTAIWLLEQYPLARRLSGLQLLVLGLLTFVFVGL